MKTIGLLGGTSWPSTIEYYRILNELAQQELGGFHSASLLLRSIDYHEIKSRYHERWAEIPELLEREISAFAALGPDCLVICNNTLHKAFDVIAGRLALPIPVFHAVAVTGQAACAMHCQRLLLLGTKFTMEDGFYQRGLERFGLQVATPEEKDRARIQEIQSELARGTMRDAHRADLAALIEKHAESVDAVVLACTELPLAIRQADCRVPLLNPTALQCREAFRYATGAAAA
ncbi:MAG: amino acid racemase [Burkholderiales bacterium]